VIFGLKTRLKAELQTDGAFLFALICSATLLALFFPWERPVTANGLAPTFKNLAEAKRITFRHRSSATARKYLPETMGSGVALFDCNGDTRLDVFFSNGAKIHDPMPKGALPRKEGADYWNRLYRQEKDGSFTDVTVESGLKGEGYNTGVAVGDYDNDGDPDLFVGGIGGNWLYRNNGDGTFSDVTDRAGVKGSGWASSSAFVDYDQDGFLDLVVGRYLDWSFEKDIYCGEPKVRAYCHPKYFGRIAPLLFHNERDGKFADVTAESGLAGYLGKALGVGIADMDRDGRTDIFIANDGIEQFLLRNQGQGKFEESAIISGVAMDQDGNSYAGMGVDVSDYNNDGLPDIVVTNLSNEVYAVYKNEGGGAFSHVSADTGVAKITLLFSGWGLRFVDYDNDSWRDLFIVQGHVLDTIEITSPHLRYAQPPFLLRNQGGRNFTNVSAKSGDIFAQPSVGRGLAVGDIDNDGDEDVVASVLDGPAPVYLNEGGNARGNWIILDPTGTKSNRDGIGAEITLTTASGSQFATVTTTSSYQSSSDHRVHFGVGKQTAIPKIEIRWPSGTVQSLEKIRVNQILEVVEP